MQKNSADIKDNVRKRYAKIALSGNNDSCCMPGDCCETTDIGYKSTELKSIPSASILGVECDAPLNFADLQEGEVVVDLGSGAGIDVFLSANKVGKEGKVIGIDMTDEMLEKARKNAKEHGYTNVEFRKGDIEKQIPVEENSVDLVISNCVINLTNNKLDTFKQVFRILKRGGRGRMAISDLVTDKEIASDSADVDRWCSCIDGALTKEHYIQALEMQDLRMCKFCKNVHTWMENKSMAEELLVL
jgi:arsenite methyltransferase